MLGPCNHSAMGWDHWGRARRGRGLHLIEESLWQRGCVAIDQFCTLVKSKMILRRDASSRQGRGVDARAQVASKSVDGRPLAGPASFDRSNNHTGARERQDRWSEPSAVTCEPMMRNPRPLSSFIAALELAVAMLS